MENQSANVQSIKRIFSIIELLALHPQGMALQAMAETTGLPKSTIHRLLGNLIAMDYVSQDTVTLHYKLTLKLFEMSSNIVNNTDIYTSAKQPLDALASQTGEVVHLVMRNNTDIVYIYKAISRVTRMTSQIGNHAPMYRTGVGKAILSTLPDNEIKRIWDATRIEKVTQYTITEFEVLMQQIYRIRSVGYAIDFEENEIGTRCVAFALPGVDGHAETAFSVSGPAPLITEERIKDIAKLGKEIQHDILYNMGMRSL